MRINTQTHHFLADYVLKKAEKGGSIANTPHVGNAWVEDFYHHSDGANQADFFGNCSQKDVIDQPEYKIENGIKQLLTKQKDVMTPYLRTDEGEIVGHMHYKSRREYLVRLEKENNHFTTFEYIFNREMSPQIIDIMKYLIKRGEKIFGRKISDNGIVSNYLGNQVEHDVDKYIEFSEKKNLIITKGLDINPGSGLILNNDANVFLCIIIEHLTQKLNGDNSNEVVLISGPSMINYINNSKFLYFLQNSYLQIKNDFKLPEEINVNLVPGSTFSFVPTSHETEILQTFNDFIYPLMHSAKEIQEKLKRCESDKSNLISAMQEIKGALGKSVDSLKRLYSNRRITQYDLNSRNSIVTELPFEIKCKYTYSELSRIFKSLS